MIFYGADTPVLLDYRVYYCVLGVQVVADRLNRTTPNQIPDEYENNIFPSVVLWLIFIQVTRLSLRSAARPIDSTFCARENFAYIFIFLLSSFWKENFCYVTFASFLYYPGEKVQETFWLFLFWGKWNNRWESSVVTPPSNYNRIYLKDGLVSRIRFFLPSSWLLFSLESSSSLSERVSLKRLKSC